MLGTTFEERLADIEAALKISPPLPEKPGGPDNWVERHGVKRAGGRGLPPYIDRIARSLFHKNKARFPTVGSAVKTAVSRVKNWCATSTDASVKAKACNAVRQWAQMRAKASASRATKSEFAELLGEAATKAVGTVDDYDMAFIEFLGMEIPDDFEVPDKLDDETEQEIMDLAHGFNVVVDGPGSEGVAAASSEGTAVSSGETPGEDASPELTGPIVQKSAYRQVAYAPVLVPGEPDVDGDVVTAEKIQEVAWDFMANHRYMDEQHRLDGQVATPVESYILREEMAVEIAGKSETLPEGTWIIGAHLPNEADWSRVMSGELEGLSITAVRKGDFEAAKAKAQAAATKSAQESVEPAHASPLTRVTIRELGEDWIGPAVSVVKGPAVPKAKWFAFKSKEEPKRESLWERIVGVVKSDKESDTTGEVLDVQITQEELNKLIEAEAEKKVTELLDALEDEEDGDEDEDEDDEDGITFSSQEELDAYIREQAEAAIVEAVDEADEDDDDEDDADEGDRVEALEGELAAVKSALTKLSSKGKSDKSRQIAGNEGEGERTGAFNMNDYLGRDAMGNYVGAKK